MAVLRELAGTISGYLADEDAYWLTEADMVEESRLRDSFRNFKGSLDEKGSLGKTDAFPAFGGEETSSQNKRDDWFFEPPADAPRRINSIAFCKRCGCRLSQYRDPGDKHCCACSRAMNPLFDKSA